MQNKTKKHKLWVRSSQGSDSKKRRGLWPGNNFPSVNFNQPVDRKKNGGKEQCLPRYILLLRLEIKANPSRMTPAIYYDLAKLLREALNTLVGRADFDFFVRFENTASCCVNVRRHAGYMLALANSACLLLALSRSDRHVRQYLVFLLLCAGLIALTMCCAR